MTIAGGSVFCDLLGCHKAFAHHVPYEKSDPEWYNEIKIREHFEKFDAPMEFQMETINSAAERATITDTKYNPLDFCCRQHSLDNLLNKLAAKFESKYPKPIARMK